MCGRGGVAAPAAGDPSAPSSSKTASAIAERESMRRSLRPVGGARHARGGRSALAGDPVVVGVEAVGSAADDAERAADVVGPLPLPPAQS